MIVESTQFSLWLQCILFDNKLSIYLYLSLSQDFMINLLTPLKQVLAQYC